jgi:hypothetical protein
MNQALYAHMNNKRKMKKLKNKKKQLSLTPLKESTISFTIMVDLWLMPIALATQETDWEITVQGQSRQKFHKTPISTNKN